MKITDCPWELNNLGCRVVEIYICSTEDINEEEILSIESQYEYVVIKMETGNMRHTTLMTRLGYTLAETQLSLKKPYADWYTQEDGFATAMLGQLKIEPVQLEEDLQDLLGKITDDMFSTDRIYLDPQFGSAYSARRYRNWIASEFKKGALLYKHYFRSQYVGFSLCKLEGENLHCLLAGNFKQYQRTGLGFWIPLIPLQYPDQQYKNYVTSISTNNYPVWQMYNRHHYIVTRFDYVYVKHIKH